jgi:signal transduction histidine kinase
LQKANRELKARTDDLAKANQEFSLAAKTSALGAITAHLIHGLKNPLAGLEDYVTSQSNGGDRSPGDEWHAAMETTRRLRSLVNEVVGILREEQTGGAVFCVTTDELLTQAETKVRPLAAACGVTLTCRSEAGTSLPNRQANLALLILDNLLRNACEATPRGHRVTLVAGCDPGKVWFLVEDEGPGLPEKVNGRLFQPVASARIGGSGIGLVISRHLAQHAGGRLELVRNSVNGCCFRLSIPVEATGSN